MTAVLIDSNVLLDLMTEDPQWYAWSAAAVEKAADVAPGGDDECFGYRAGGDHEIVFGFKNRNAGVRFLFVEHDCHQRRRIDRDHPGRPSSP